MAYSRRYYYNGSPQPYVYQWTGSAYPNGVPPRNPSDLSGGGHHHHHGGGYPGFWPGVAYQNSPSQVFILEEDDEETLRRKLAAKQAARKRAGLSGDDPAAPPKQSNDGTTLVLLLGAGLAVAWLMGKQK